MSPIVLPRNERAAARRGGSVGPGVQDSQGHWGRPRPLGPQGVAGSGDTEAGSAEGLGWELRVPHPAPPAAPARLQKRRRAGAANPRRAAGSREDRPRGRGGTAGAKARRPGRALPPSTSGPPAPSPPPPRNSPPRAAPSPAEGAAAGPAGLGGAARARPPGRGSPRASTCRGARGAGSPADAFIAAAAAAAAAAASSFLLRRPLIGPGGGLRAPSSVRARRSRRRAPQAAAAAAATVVAAARAGKLCPFVRSAPEAAGRLRAAFSIILTRERKSRRRTSSPYPAPVTHPPAHLMPGSRVGEGEEPTQPR